MRRALLHLTVLLAALAAFAVSAVPAFAQDPSDVPSEADSSAEDDLAERIKRIRELPREEQMRLREALRRFRKLSPEQKTKLRKKVDRVGKARLRELAGRDVKRLKKRHAQIKGELREIWQMSMGAARRDQFSAEEREYLRHTAMRRFQHHVKNDLLKQGGFVANAKADRLMLKEQRRKRMSDAVADVAKTLYEEEYTAEERAQHLDEPPGRTAQRKRILILEYRKRLAVPFARQFDRGFVSAFMRAPPEERAARVAEFQRERQWYELLRVARKDLRLSRDTLKMLRELDASEWAGLRASYARKKAAGVDPERLSLELTGEIRGIHSRSPRTGRPTRSKLRHALRDGNGADTRRRKHKRKGKAGPQDRTKKRSRRDKTREPAQPGEGDDGAGAGDEEGP